MVLQTSLGTTACPGTEGKELFSSVVSVIGCRLSAVRTTEWFLIHQHEKLQPASICGAALENDTFGPGEFRPFLL